MTNTAQEAITSSSVKKTFKPFRHFQCQDATPTLDATLHRITVDQNKDLLRCPPVPEHFCGAVTKATDRQVNKANGAKVVETDSCSLEWGWWRQEDDAASFWKQVKENYENQPRNVRLPTAIEEDNETGSERARRTNSYAYDLGRTDLRQQEIGHETTTDGRTDERQTQRYLSWNKADAPPSGIRIRIYMIYIYIYIYIAHRPSRPSWTTKNKSWRNVKLKWKAMKTTVIRPFDVPSNCLQSLTVDFGVFRDSWVDCW